MSVDLVGVSGPEAVTYLQGQLSQDVAGLGVGASAPSFLLEPNGKVCAWLQIHRTGPDSFVLAVDAGYGPAVEQRLARFKLRTKAEIAPLDAQDPSAPAIDERTEDERIEAGIPRMGAELVPGSTIPAEAGQAVIDRSVSFTKGCYTGQELVARIDSRGGNVPRRLCGLTVAGGARPPVGARIEVGGADVGGLTSVAWSDARDAVVALGYVQRGVEPPVAGEVVWDGGRAPAEVRPLRR